VPRNTLIADDADLIAISDYVENQRPNIPEFPKLQSKIEEFEQWYQALTWWDLHVNMTGTFAEAARRRDEINLIMDDTLRPEWIPADRIGMKPGDASRLPGPKPPLFQLPLWFKPVALITGVGTAVLTTTLVVLHKVRLL
jgi:hypothetical protein